MNIESSSSTIWAKLIAIQPPGNQNIEMYADRNEYPFDDKFIIYQNQERQTFIQNLTASSLRIDDNLLEIHQEKQLFGGEKLSFEQDHDNTDKRVCCYVFSLPNLQQPSLKRDRNEPVPLESESLKKLVKVETDLQRELTCSICTNLLHKCMILTPCQHAFCSFCLFDHLKSSNRCPLCRVEAVSITKNSILSNVIQLVGDNFSIQQNPQKRKELDDISFCGDIVRDEEGVYIGSLVNGKKDGLGKFIYEDDGIYEGNWKNDKKEGKGVIIYDNGEKYDGDWMNNYYHGTGRYTWSNGQEYEGNFEEDYFTGFGTMKYEDGKIYQGFWKYDEREGKGAITYANGDRYEGFWMDDCQHGTGKYIWSNGEEYEGNFQDDCFEGFGIMKYKDGKIYQGNWEDNDREGLGILIFPNGDKYEGKWTFDVLQPEVKVEYSNGEKYEGEIDTKSFKKNGKGTLISKNGDQYDGDWFNDIKHGQGKYFLGGKKLTYEGVWENGKLVGEGVITYEDGAIFKANWSELEE